MSNEFLRINKLLVNLSGVKSITITDPWHETGEYLIKFKYIGDGGSVDIRIKDKEEAFELYDDISKMLNAKHIETKIVC